MYKFSENDRKSEAWKALVDMDGAGIRYCLWKSVSRFSEGVRGETDFDLLVKQEDFNRCVEFLEKSGWIKVKAECWRSFPGVYDFLRYCDGSGCFLHFHVHTALVMGEARIKSLKLPLEQLYFDTCVYADRVPAVRPALDLIVFLIRMAVKLRSRDFFCQKIGVANKLLIRNFGDEFKEIRKNVSEESLLEVLARPEFDFISSTIITDAYADLNNFGYAERQEVREALTSYYRVDNIERILLWLRRLIERRVVGTGKTLDKRGIKVAICGPDGSGKSTLCQALKTALGGHFKVRKFYMGGSNHSRGFVRFLYRLVVFPLFILIRRSLERRHFSAAQRLKNVFYGIEECLIAREKYLRFKQAEKLAQLGAISIFERFPLFDGFGDGSPENCPKPFRSICSRYYDAIDRPDLIIGLKVPAEEAILRKVNHNSEIIIRKVEQFNEFYEKNSATSNFVCFDGTESPEKLLYRALNHIWIRLVHDN
ncbi:MAG: hypothetical protein D6719_06215 [Candidatus Dadabacteria bacterium]|nr:MAG: hypothetical protein D6719_06215 [Candidatus Dadabacteria bacterium]